MPAIFHYREAISPEIIKQADGKFTLKRIPIFECHQREDINCNDQWMNACVADQQQQKSKGFKPRLIVGHTGENPSDPEKPVAAFLDNYYFDPSSRWLFADYVDVPADLLADLKSNKWPGRSAEASRSKPAIYAVALLGGTPPYFKLPDLKYAGRADDTISIFTECHMATKPKLSSDNAKKLYSDVRRYLGLPDAPPAGTVDPAMEADFAKFCELMKRYESEMSAAPSPNAPAAPDKEGEPEPEDAEKKKKAASAAPYSEPVKKEPNVADTIKYEEAIKRMDALEATNVTLTEKLATAEWTQKYSEARISPARLNVPEKVAFLMKLPADLRQTYFDDSIKSVASPSTSPVKNEAPAGPVALGSAEEAAEIKRYYEENRTKYAGKFDQAQRDYRAGARPSDKTTK